MVAVILDNLAALVIMVPFYPKFEVGGFIQNIGTCVLKYMMSCFMFRLSMRMSCLTIIMLALTFFRIPHEFKLSVVSCPLYCIYILSCLNKRWFLIRQ